MKRPRRSPWRGLWRGAAWVLAILVSGVALLAWYVGRPDPHRWTHPVTWMGIELHLPVAAGIRWASTPLGGALLHGRRFETRVGQVTVHWNESAQRLALTCAPCRVRAEAFSARPVELPVVTVTLRRSVDRLWGDVAAGAVAGRWQGRLSEQDLVVQLEIDSTPIADLYALFADAIPEVRRARIEGRVAGRATLVWPAGGVRLEPQWQLNRVEGLGTEALRGVLPAVGCAAPNAVPPPLLARARLPGGRKPRRGEGGRAALEAAVIAAEDQRFYSHHGYDPEEMQTAFAVNGERQGIARGGSSLSQQLAKLLFTGSDRTHIRKLREVLYAVEMEDTLGKAHILQLYLAIAPWGPGVCGAEAAARHYFDKPVAQLSVLEAAWLAALLRNPEQARAQPAAFLQRAQWVVHGMAGVSRQERNWALTALQQAAP